MPKGIAVLRDFSGGINSQFNPRDIQDNQLGYSQDAMGDRVGAIRTMGNGSGTPRQLNNSASSKSINTLGSTDIKGSIADATCDYNDDPTIAMDDTSKLETGMSVSGTGIPVGATVSSITNATTFELSGSTTGGSQTNNTLTFTEKRANATGYGFKHFELDYDELGRNTGEHYIAVVSAAGLLNLWDYTFNSWSATSLDLGSSTNCKALITPINNGIRVADTELTNASTIKYYMYVKRKQLGTDRSAFYVGSNNLPAPTANDNQNALVESATYDNGQFNFAVSTESGITGTWQTADYIFGISFVYDGNQESAVSLCTTGLDSSNVSEDRALKVTVYASNTGGATAYDARLTGTRIYWKYSSSLTSDGEATAVQGEWNLLVDVDITGSSSDNHAYGVRAKLGDNFNSWDTSDSGSGKTAFSTIVIPDPPIDTYATLNGYRSSDGPLIIGNAGDGYKTAIFANRRMFVANVKMPGVDGEQVQEADRIMYSPVNKPDVFPSSNFIDVVKGDAEPYLKLENVGDRLFAYKADTLYIINISNPSPSGWYLEATHKGMGILHPAAVFKTDFGLVWANPNGLFVYQEGGGIAELSEGKILNGHGTDDYSFNAWGKLITSNSIVGYSQKDKEIIINIDCSSATSNTTFGGNGADVVVYDMETQSFWYGKNRLTSGALATNFDYDWNGDLIYGSEASDTVTIRSWQSDSQTSDAFVFSTKDIDFGSPGKKKKVYNIYITYKHSDSNNVSNFLSYSTNGGTSFVTYDGDGSTAISNNTLDQATSWEIHKFTFTTPIECQSMTLKFNGPTSDASKIDINDISIEYRELYGRVSAT